jgi:hypothetical protein
MHNKLENAIKGFCFFLILGPPLGGLILAVSLLAEDFITRGHLESKYVINAFLFTTVFSYAVGAIPAAISGLFAGIIRPRIVNKFNCVLFGFSSAAIALACKSIASREIPGIDELIMYGLPGFFSGAILSWFFRNKESEQRGPNNGVGVH